MSLETTPLLITDNFESKRKQAHVTVAETLALYGPEALSDQQIIETMLTRTRPGRAEEILLQSGSIAGLAAMGAAELKGLGLSRSEMARFPVLPEVQRRSTRNMIRPRISSPRSAGDYLLPKVVEPDKPYRPILAAFRLSR